MPLTGADADTRYVHLLEDVGVHLLVKCPDCKRDIMMMAQLSSIQSAQDTVGARSFSQDESEVVLGVNRQKNTPDTFDLESRLSDPTFVLNEKRTKRKLLMDKREQQSNDSFSKAFAQQMASNKARMDNSPGSSITTPTPSKFREKKSPEAVPTMLASSSPATSSFTVDPDAKPEAKPNQQHHHFHLKPPPPVNGRPSLLAFCLRLFTQKTMKTTTI